MAEQIPIQFKVSPVTQHERRVPVRVVSKKPIRFIRHGGFVPADGVGIAYVSLPQISKDNIYLRDLSTDYIENSDRMFKRRRIENNVFSTLFHTFLITDLFVAPDGEAVVPLFYKHDLSAETTVTEVRVFDRNQKEIDDSIYTWVAATKTLYHNLPFSFDEETGDHSVYFISYLDANLERKTSLLQTDRAYKEHLAADGAIDPTKRTYSVGDAGGAFTITINYNAPAQVYYFQAIKGGQIRPLLPARTDADDSWFMRFTNGEIYVTTDGSPRRFHVPEYVDQPFLPVQPYKYAAFDDADIVSRRIVRTKRWPLEIDTTANRFVDILVTDELDQPLRGYTNNPARTFWSDISGKFTATRLTQISTTNVSFNNRDGFIYLDTDLESGNKVVVSHYHKEEDLEYIWYNLNPIYNRSVLGKRIIFYARPNVANGSGNRAIFHIEFDELSMAVTAFTDEALSLVPGSVLLADIDPQFDTYKEWRQNDPQVLWLASVAVRKRAGAQDVFTIDTRVKGGGLKEDVDPTSYYDAYPDIASFSEVANWDGRPFPGRGTAYIELPCTLITGKGTLGTEDDIVLTREDVGEIAKRHMAHGHYPIIRYYGDKPTITGATSVSTTNTTVTLTWSSVPGATGYRVYHGDMLQTTFLEVAATTTQLTAAPTLTYNVFNTRPAYFYVVPLFDGNEGCRSDIIHIQPGDVDPSTFVSVAFDAVLFSGSLTLSVTMDAVLT